MSQRLSTRLKRHWYATPGMEWLIWRDPRTAKILAFQIILTEACLFVEWRPDRKLRAGRHDDGEVLGRHKMTPMLVPTAGSADEVRCLVLQTIEKLEEPHPVPKPFLAFIIEALLQPVEQRNSAAEQAPRDG